MSATRVAIIAATLTLAAFATTAIPVSAADIGCGGNTIEVCQPVCVTEPCNGYVCVHHEQADVCKDL